MAIIEPRGFRFSVDHEGFSSDGAAARAIGILYESLSRLATIHVAQLHEALTPDTKNLAQTERSTEMIQRFALEAIETSVHAGGLTGSVDGLRLNISAVQSPESS